jgi:hypothetical protein
MPLIGLTHDEVIHRSNKAQELAESWLNGNRNHVALACAMDGCLCAAVALCLGEEADYLLRRLESSQYIKMVEAKPTYDTYSDAFETLPNGSVWSCCFGFKGEGGFSEYWRSPCGRKFVISNGRWDSSHPFVWTVEEAA